MALSHLSGARRLQLVRQASMHLRAIANDRAAGPALALLGEPLGQPGWCQP
jgi:hypothetical protein